MNIFETIAYRGLEALGKYYGNYRAIVTEVADDQNRVPVVIPSICKNQILAYPKSQDGNIDSGFKWLPPSPGQVVYVEFLSGDLAYPLWSYHGWGKNEMPPILRGKKAGFRTPKGHQVVLSEEEGILNISIATPNNPDEFSTEISISDNVSILTSGNVDISSEEFTFNEGKTGLPKADELVKKINALESEVNSLRNALFLASPALVALVPTWATVQTWSTNPPLIPTKLSEISNQKVKQ